MYWHTLTPFIQILAATLAFFIPPFRYRALVFTPLIIFLICITISSASSSKDLDFQAFCMNQWPWYLATLEKLFFTNPEQDFWRVDQPKAEAASMPMGLSKLRWSTALRLNLRGVGWNYQVKNIPQSTGPQTKWRFILYQLGSYVKTYLILDILSTYSSRNFYHSPDLDLASLTIRHPSWIRSFINVFYAGANVYYSIDLSYIQGSILAVLLGLSQPKVSGIPTSPSRSLTTDLLQDWPPVFGNIRDVTTVRWFWGGFWHQLIRRPFSSWSQALVSFLHIPRGTLLSSYTQLYTTFAISGFFHGVISHITPASQQHTVYESFWLYFNFFILQGMAIQFEDAVIGSYERLFPTQSSSSSSSSSSSCHHAYQSKGNGKRGDTADVEISGVTWKTILGYIWVIGWFCFSLGWAGDASLKSGLYTIQAAKFSIIRPLLKLDEVRYWLGGLID